MYDNENITQLLKWLPDVLNSQKIHEHYRTNVVVSTPWSVVIKVEVGQAVVYLKQTPPDLFTEPGVINCIHEKAVNAPVPKILFINHELHCFIMDSCGDYSLRTKFNGLLDADLITDGIESYIKMQRTLECSLSDFEEIGVPDWRITCIPQLYADLLVKKEMLLEEGLTPDEIHQLIKLIPTITSICQLVSQYKIKETLVNCDFNENNMIIDQETKKISLIDWGETVIAHPFFSLASIFRNTTRRYPLESKEEIIGSIRKKCASYWLDVVDESELNEVYRNIERLLPIFTSLSLYRLQAATNNNSKKMQRWFIKDFLKILIRNERG
jgi:hypothetical protein